MQKFCGACGAELKSGANFCNLCGHALRAPSAKATGEKTSSASIMFIVLAVTISVLAVAGSAYWSWRGKAAASPTLEIVESTSSVNSPAPPSDDVSEIQSSYTAALTDTEARFVFPFDANAIYEWCPGGLQYGAEVKVGRGYQLGFTMFTPMGASNCERGDLEKLLDNGQTSVWKKGSDGSSAVVPAKISTQLSNTKDALVVTLEGRDVINLLFGDRPSKVTLVRTLKTEISEKSVRVEYRGQSPKATTPSAPNVEFGPGIADFKTKTIRPMRIFYFEQDGSIKWFNEMSPAGEGVTVETLRTHNGQLICMVNDAERLWTNCDDLAPPQGGWANTKVFPEQ